jgi:hypothetical protein
MLSSVACHAHFDRWVLLRKLGIQSDRCLCRIADLWLLLPQRSARSATPRTWQRIGPIAASWSTPTRWAEWTEVDPCRRASICPSLSISVDRIIPSRPSRCFRGGCATPASTSRHAREMPRLRRRLLSPGFPAGRQDADRDGGPARDARSCKPTLRETALPLGFVDEKTLDRVVDPGEMVRPNVASAT